MSNGYLKFIEEHSCETLEHKVGIEAYLKSKGTEIGIEKYDEDTKGGTKIHGWFFVEHNPKGRTVLNQITYCPYCGKKLD